MSVWNGIPKVSVNSYFRDFVISGGTRIELSLRRRLMRGSSQGILSLACHQLSKVVRLSSSRESYKSHSQVQLNEHTLYLAMNDSWRQLPKNQLSYIICEKLRCQRALLWGSYDCITIPSYPHKHSTFNILWTWHAGYFPVKLEALREGSVVHARVPVYQVCIISLIRSTRKVASAWR
jgi:hypothetical protein